MTTPNGATDVGERLRWLARTALPNEVARLRRIRESLRRRIASYEESEARGMSYPDWQHDVEKFHQKFDITRPWIPQPPTIEDAVARCMLLVKKVGELIATMDAEDMVGVSENIVDLIYLAVGTARVYGLDLEPLWEEIHTTNMAKIATSSYKVAKPMGWIPPRVRELLLEQGWEPPGSEED